MCNYIYEDKSKEFRHAENEIHKIEDEYFRTPEGPRKNMLYEKLQRERRKLWRKQQRNGGVLNKDSLLFYSQNLQLLY